MNNLSLLKRNDENLHVINIIILIIMILFQIKEQKWQQLHLKQSPAREKRD
jgi:hypothetical protein